MPRFSISYDVKDYWMYQQIRYAQHTETPTGGDFLLDIGERCPYGNKPSI